MKLVRKIHDYTRHIKNSSNCAGRLPVCNCENGVMDSLRNMTQRSATVDIGLFTQSQTDNGVVSSLIISCLNISWVLSRLNSEIRDTQKEKEMLNLQTVSTVVGQRVAGGWGDGGEASPGSRVQGAVKWII